MGVATLPSIGRDASRAGDFGDKLRFKVEDEVTDLLLEGVETVEQTELLRLDVEANPDLFPPGSLAEIAAFVVDQAAKLDAFLLDTATPDEHRGDVDLRKALKPPNTGHLHEQETRITGIVRRVVKAFTVLDLLDRDIIDNSDDHIESATLEVNEVRMEQTARIQDFRDSLAP